jgi:type IV pilus assembly protein PilN
MRIDINLASQPYEDARQFWLRWGTALAVVAVLTLALLAGTVTGWLNARRDRAKIADLRTRIGQRDETRQQAEDFLNRPENRATRDESQLLNDLIEHKAFSWTRVLEDLEKVMPPRVHLVSIRPEVDEDNQLALKMVVAGDTRERGIELERRMEDSRRFARTRIADERYQQSTAGDNAQMDIVAIYVPETLPEPAAAPAPAAKSRTESPKAQNSKRRKPDARPAANSPKH